MIELPLTVNSELSPPIDADVSAPELSTVRSSAKDAGGDDPVLTTESELDDVVVCADSSDIAPARFWDKVVERTLVSSSSSLVVLNDNPRSLRDRPPIEVFNACSICVVMVRIVPSPNKTELESTVPSELSCC